MASITSTGIGSGLDVPNLVQQLVAAEGQPTELRIARKEARFQAELSALGSVKSALSDLQSQLGKMTESGSLLARSARVDNEELLGVSADESALPGSYDIEVVALAKAQRLQSAAFAGTDATAGTGTLTIAVGAESFDVIIDEGANTLADVQDAINNAVDNKGVVASIVNADDGSYLFLTAENTGSDRRIRVTQSGGDGGLSAFEFDPDTMLGSMTEVTAASDALVRINGFDVTSDSNSIEGAIEGVTLDLLRAEEVSIATLVIDNDRDSVRGEIEAFVETYNQLLETFDKQTAYDQEAETAGPLLGDATVRGVRDQLRRELTIAVGDIDASFASLLDLGITTDIDGRLEINAARLDEVLDGEFSKLGQLFTGEDGYAARLSAIIETYVDGADGVLTKKVEGIEGSIDDLADQREALSLRLQSVEARLLKQFNALDALVGELTSTSNFLTQQLAALPKINVNRNDSR